MPENCSQLLTPFLLTNEYARQDLGDGLILHSRPLTCGLPRSSVVSQVVSAPVTDHIVIGPRMLTMHDYLNGGEVPV